MMIYVTREETKQLLLSNKVSFGLEWQSLLKDVLKDVLKMWAMHHRKGSNLKSHPCEYNIYNANETGAYTTCLFFCTSFILLYF